MCGGICRDQDIADLLGLSWVKNAKIGPEPGADVLMSGEEQTEELFCTKLEVIRSCHKQGLGSCAVHLDLLDEKTAVRRSGLREGEI
jgi:hypothetical protein